MPAAKKKAPAKKPAAKNLQPTKARAHVIKKESAQDKEIAALKRRAKTAEERVAHLEEMLRAVGFGHKV